MFAAGIGPGRLCENPPQRPVAFLRPSGLLMSGAFMRTGRQARPTGAMRGRGKTRSYRHPIR